MGSFLGGAGRICPKTLEEILLPRFTNPLYWLMVLLVQRSGMSCPSQVINAGTCGSVEGPLSGEESDGPKCSQQNVLLSRSL